MKTPRYEFDENIIKNNYKKIKEKLEFCEIYYDIKVNDHPLILNLLKKINSLFKCNSKYEFDKILNIGVNPNSVIFGLPIKTSEIISYVYNKGCRYFVFDDIRELVKIEKYAPNAKKILLVDFSDITFPINHYGMSYEKIYSETMKYNYSERIDGLMYQIDNNNIEIVYSVMDKIKDIFKLLDYNNKEYLLNIGEGFRANGSEEFYKQYREILINMKNNFKCRLIAEPGEIIVASAGCFIVKIISIKKRKDDVINVYVDGGYPNGFGFATFYGTVNKVGEIKYIGNGQVYNFIDCTNLNKPMLSTSLNFELGIGDILKFTNSGTYTLVYQNDFHMWDKCDVIMI